MVDHTAQRSRKARELWPQSDVLRLGMNWSEEDLDKPQILIDDAWGESHPCSVHLNTLPRGCHRSLGKGISPGPISCHRYL